MVVRLGLHGMGAGIPMAWMLRCVGQRDLGLRSTWVLVPAWNWDPHRQSAAGALGRHAGGTVKSDSEVPLWPEQ